MKSIARGPNIEADVGYTNFVLTLWGRALWVVATQQWLDTQVHTCARARAHNMYHFHLVQHPSAFATSARTHTQGGSTIGRRAVGGWML